MILSLQWFIGFEKSLKYNLLNLVSSLWVPKWKQQWACANIFRWLISYIYYLYLELWKPGRHSLTFHNVLCLILAFLLCCSRLMSIFFAFLACFLVRNLFSSECRNNYIPPAQPAPSHPYVFVPTHNSFFNTSDTELFQISARLKLVSLPFSSLLLHIVQW